MEAPELFQGNYCSQFSAEKHGTGSDHFIVEELLDFSDEDPVLTGDGATSFDSVTGNSTDSSSTVTVVEYSCNSLSFSGCEPNLTGDNGCSNFSDSHFSSGLCVPYDDLADLEWVSNFVEESFSCEDLQKLQLISGVKARSNESSEINRNNNINANPNNPILMAVPGKARSKRSRAAPCNWASRLPIVSPITSLPPESQIILTGPPPQSKRSVKFTKKKDNEDEGNGEGRKCLHCATDKTPQWRKGPMGPKTLCNACGVRYKSGRLVPEYRPAASPTFVLTRHSNSHRKVLELRRQKEMLRAQQQQQQQPHQFMHHHQNMMFDLSNGDDYLIHQHVGPDFRELI